MKDGTKILIGAAGIGAAWLALKSSGNPPPLRFIPEPSPSLRSYVARMLPIARTIEADGGPPAVFGLAQGSLESGNGGSGLTRKAKNHFGIKAFRPPWTGDGITMRTREVKKDGTEYYVDAEFRAYPTDEACWRDWAKLASRLAKKGGLPPGSRDPRAWADAVQRGGWATDPRYAGLIRRRIDLVETILSDSAPVAGPRRMTPAEIAKIARGAGFSGRPLAVMTAIGLAESDGDPTARNGQHVGIWQVASTVHGLDPKRLEDPIDNALIARRLYLWAEKNKPSPYQPWTAWSDGRYMARMDDAERAVQELPV